ncbi:hypothetical protein [Polyangium aurulentum]|uniref:hypothetical protein n=1 Tax=Polyangium aurulentum TaxID=2567896 RepID=UPI00113AC2EE|nr:hypothetical protein [Polyangium aurulentum]UQA58303.1 hypothetical protein E8A73_044835 [Polyangium aurulentum]
MAVITLAALFLGAWAAHRPLARWYILREARARGVELEFGEMSLSMEKIVLGDCRARLEGVAGVSLRADAVTIALVDFEPKRVDAKKAAVTIEGPIEERVRGLSAWTRRHEEAMRVPAEGDVRVDWAPWMSVSGRGTSAGDGSGRFEGDAAFEGTKLGLVGVRWARGAPVTVGLGKGDPEGAPVRAVIDIDKTPMTATVTLAPLLVDAAAAALGLTAPPAMRGARAEGTATVSLGTPETKGMPQGNASFEVTGWVPPHPKELDGIVFGKKTKLGASFEITPDLAEVRISKATVEAGAFRLTGGGTVNRQKDHARIRMDLSGAIPCSELGVSVVKTHVPGLLGDLIGGAARMGLGGNAKVAVRVTADTRKLDDARIDQSVVLACTLGR